MRAEDTIRALLHDAAPMIRGALRDATVDALVEDFTSGLRRLLRQAYDVGYREGLAQAHGQELAPPDPAVPVRIEAVLDDDLEPEDASSPVNPCPVDPGDLESGPHASSSAEVVDGENEPAEEPPPVDWGSASDDSHTTMRAVEQLSTRIFPHATIGTLLQRIHDYFGLERFDIDVVVCRKGDRSRRQLKKSVRLAKYAVEE